jgi:APA family basic amino acid/polyamine antiporter
MVAGIIIGASIFVQPSEVDRHAPSAGAALAVWIVAGVLTLFGCLVCAELSSAYPKTGGIYVYLKETLNPACGFLWGWTMFWCAHSGIIAAASVVLARYVGFFMPLGDAGIKLVAIGAILALSFVNYLGVRQGSRLQAAVTGAKIAAIALLLGLVAVFGHSAGASAGVAGSAMKPATFDGFVLGVSAALFAFGGWHMVTYTAGETRDAARTIPRALLLGIAIVTVCYVALNAAYLYLLPIDKVASSTRVAADAALTLAGARGAAMISALVILSATGVLNGVILAGPGAYRVMAEDGLAFGWLAKPQRALAAQTVWSCALVATGTYRALFTRVVYTEWLFFALMTFGLFRLRRSAGYKPGYRAWGYPAIPAIFAAAALVVAAIQIAEDPWNSAAGLGIVVLGLPVYLIWIRPNANHRLS